MMEVRLLLVLVLALTLTGSDAQIDVCGVAPLNSLTRIVGGDNAAEGAWPWQAYVEDDKGYNWAGSLITNQWVLTSASPIKNSSNLIVTLGTNILKPPSSNNVARAVSKVVLHPDYNSQTSDHNIALLQLSSPVTFTDYIRPVCLASEHIITDVGTTMWSTGWGDIQTNVSLLPPYRLQQVTVPVVSNQECDRIYIGEVTDNMLCAGGQAGRGPCRGDVGGPLVLKTDSRWVQVGVLIFWSSSGCALGNKPAGFTRVSHYQQWIKSVTGSDQPGFVPDVSPSLPPDVSPSLPPDVSPSLPPDVSPSLAPSLPPDVSPSLAPSLPPDGSPGLAPVTLLLGAALVLSSVLVHS